MKQIKAFRPRAHFITMCSHHFSSLLLISICLLNPLAIKKGMADDTQKYRSIETLINNETLTCSIKGLGGYQDKCVQLNIKNLSSTSVYVSIEAGRILDSKVDGVQNIFIVKSQKIAFAEHQKKEVIIIGFCCQSSNHSPCDTSTFSIGEIAPKKAMKNLGRLLDSIDFDNQAMQNAIWFLSNNHSLASVVDPDPKKQKLLRDSLSAWTGIQIPWYDMKYANDPNQVFSAKPETIRGYVEYYVPNNASVSILVRNNMGTIMDVLINKSPRSPENYRCDFELNVKKYAAGDYYILVSYDGVMVQKKSFSL